MNIVTIPKNLIKNDDLIVLPKKEYESLLQRQRIIPVVKLSAVEKKTLKLAREEMDRGEYVTLKELEYDLGVTRWKKH